MNRTPVIAAMLALLTAFTIGCAGRGPSTPPTATTGDLVTHSAGIIRAGLPQGPCPDLRILPDDRTGRHARWLGAVADSVARVLRRHGVRAYTGRPPVGVGRTVRLTSDMSGPSLVLHLTLDPEAVDLGMARLEPPPEEETPGRGSRFRDRVWTPGPLLPGPVLDARVVEAGPDGIAVALLTPDGVRLLRGELTDPVGETHAEMPLDDLRRVAAPPDYGLMWWQSTSVGNDPPPSRSLGVAASYLRSPGDIALTPGHPPPAEMRPLDPAIEVGLGTGSGRLAPDGIGVVLTGAPEPVADRPLTGWAERDGVYLAIDVEGNLSYGDRRGLWARPEPGYGPVLLAVEDGWVTTRDTGDGTALVHAVISASRRLSVTDRVRLGSLRVRAMEAVDLNLDARDDLLLVVSTGEVDRLLFFLTDPEETP